MDKVHINNHQSQKLVNAVKEGRNNLIIPLIEEGADINYRDGGFKSALAYAELFCNNVALQLLIHYGKDLQNTSGLWTATSGLLTASVEKFNHHAFDILVSSGKLTKINYYNGLKAAIKFKNNVALDKLIKPYNFDPEDGVKLLNEAISEKNYRAIDKLISKEIDFNIKSPREDTPLTLSIRLNETSVANKLISLGAGVNIEDKFNDKPLTLAKAYGNQEIIDKLIAKGAIENSLDHICEPANCDKRDPERYGNTKLIEAAWSDDNTKLRSYIYSGASPNIGNYDQGYAILNLAIEGNYAGIKAILGYQGVNLDVHGRWGETALGLAISRGYKDIAMLLVEAGANPNHEVIQEGVNETPLMIAIRKGYNDIVSKILDHNKYISFENKEGINLWQWARRNENYDAINLLNRVGKEPLVTHDNHDNRSYQTVVSSPFVVRDHYSPDYTYYKEVQPLDFCKLFNLGLEIKDQNGTILSLGDVQKAVGSNDLSFVEYYLDKAVLIDNTLVEIAASFGHLTMVKLLIAKGAKIGEASLKYAAGSGNVELIEFLIENGTAITKDVMVYAVRNNNIAAVKLLIQKGVKIEAGSELLSTVIRYTKYSFEMVETLIENGSDINDNLVEYAIRKNDLQLAKYLIDQGGKLPEISYPLILDTKGDKETVIKFLLDKGAKICDRAIGNAAYNKDYNIVQLLVDHSAKVNFHDLERFIQDGQYELALSIFKRDNNEHKLSYKMLKELKKYNDEALELILSKGVQIESYALSSAIVADDKEIIEYLLANNVVIEPYTGYLVAKNNNFQLVQILAEKENTTMEFATEGAASSNNFEILDYLLVKGAKIGNNAIANAAVHNHLKMVNYLLEKGAVIEQYAIKWAARKGHLAMVELLLDNGAVMSKELLHEAVVSGNIQLVKYLIDKGAKPGDSEIKKAICDNNFELTKLLAENGAVIPNSIYAVIEELHWCKLPINSEIKEYINSYDHNANIGKQQAEVSIREDLNAEIMGQNAIYNITTHEEL